MKLKHSHRNAGKANVIPRTATFNRRKPQIGAHATFGSVSKKKK